MPYNQFYMKLLLTQFLIAVICCGGVLSANRNVLANRNRLENTKTLNFTFYFEYVYPVPQVINVKLVFWKTGANLSELADSFKSAAVTIKEEAAKINAVITKSPEMDSYDGLTIVLAKQHRMFAEIQIETSEQSLNGFLSAIAQNSATQNVYIAVIERYSSENSGSQAQIQLARVKAITRGKQVCEKYLDMDFKQLVTFEKILEFGEKSLNDSSLQNEEEEFVGTLDDVFAEIDRNQILEEAIDLNDFFRCQIICENNLYRGGAKVLGDKRAPASKKIDAKAANEKVQEKLNSKKQQSRSKENLAKPPKRASANDQPLRKGKSKPFEKYQKLANDEL